MLREIVDVGHRCPPPSIDGLAGIANGRHRMAPAEQRGEHSALRHAGVLVLVEKHDLRGGALGDTHGGAALGKPRPQSDLITEIHQVERALRGPVLVHQIDQFESPARRRVQGRQTPLARGTLPAALQGGGRVGFEDAKPPLVEFPQACRLDKMLVELGLQLDQSSRDRVDRAGKRLDAAAVPAQHPGRKLEALRLRQEPGLRLDTDPQTVVADQACGIGMVGRDDGLPVILAPRFATFPRASCIAPKTPAGGCDRSGSKRPADARGQLCRCLVGEGEPEHRGRADLPGHDEPHHPGGHDRGLAGARAGHDHCWLHRGSGGTKLLGRERHAQ